MELSILIPTVSSRTSLLGRLLATLEPQIYKDEVEVIVHTGDDIGVGDKCNRMFQEARGRLVVSIDDDDNVTGDYCKTILSASSTSSHTTDFIGYRTAYSRNGIYQYDIYQDARPSHLDDTHRHVSLKNPIARDIAKQFEFTNQVGGDAIWCEQVRESGLIKNPVFIDKALYLYDFWDAGTIGPVPGHPNHANQRDVGARNYDKEKFRWIN